MRIIKFKGKDINGLWYNGLLTFAKGMPYIWHMPKDADKDDYIPKGYPVIRETIGQFTGKLDKNDKEIYEGDILSDFVNTDEGVMQSKEQVYWCEETAAYKLDNSYNQDKSINELLSESLANFNYKIIGNINDK